VGRVILYFLAGMALLLIFRWIMNRIGPPSGGASDPSKGSKMVKDPLCGLHIPVDRAVVKQIGGESRYFCSEECAGQFSAEKVWPHE